MSMINKFESARRVSVPLLAIRTADQFATTAALAAALAEEFAVTQWDAASGIIPLNKAGEKAVTAAKIRPGETQGFVDAMVAAAGLPEGAVLIAHNVGRQLHTQEPRDTAAAVQAVANLRDMYKLNFRMLVCLGPDFKAPAETEHDFVVIDHALPGPDELKVMVEELHDAIKLDGTAKPPKITPAEMTRALEANSGLSLFSAEQNTAMSFDEDGRLDIDALWERKYVSIEQRDGLSVYRGRETFDDLRGLDSVKARLRQHVTGRVPVGVAVWIDEGSDVFANVENDSSGVKTDQQRALLVEMEQHDWRGMIFVGVPGSGKSAVARAFGNEAKVPTIAVDFGAMENKYVGASEANLRSALDVIKRVGNGNAFFILTCNSLKGIRPQFQRRFRRGVFFFDLPTADEREAIWQLYERKFGLKKQPRPADDGWTGAEIRECCASAWDTNTTLLEAAKFVIPVSRSRAPEIEAMREEAHGRFLDASRPGAYGYTPEPMAKQVRAIILPPRKSDGTEVVN